MELAMEELNGRTGHEAGRQLLEKLYRRVTGQPMPAIAVTEMGKPYFADGPWHFSISHTQNYVFCALSEKNFGLDAEPIGRPVPQRLAQRYLSEGENGRLGDDPQDALLRLWVLKEAEAKRTGQGIGNWLKCTDFDPLDERIQEISGHYGAVLEDDHAL